MRTSDSIKELSTAMSKFQGSIQNAKKETENPYYRSRYADLAEVFNTVRKSLTEYGLSVLQGAHETETGKWVLVTKLIHLSGEWVETEYPILTAKQDAQGFGSAMTYARRYSLSSMLGVAQEDDDGNEASKESTGKTYGGSTLSPAKQEITQVTTEQTKPFVTQMPMGKTITEMEYKKLVDMCTTKKVPKDYVKTVLQNEFNNKEVKQLTKIEYLKLCGILNLELN